MYHSQTQHLSEMTITFAEGYLQKGVTTCFKIGKLTFMGT